MQGSADSTEARAAAAAAAGRGVSGLRLELKLWRADLLSGVLHLDGNGRVMSTSETPLYEPGPLLGASNQSLLRSHIGDLLPPMQQRPVTDLLLPEFGAVAVGVNVKKGGLKPAKGATVKDLKPGPTSVLSIAHRTDGLPLDLAVQAVHGWGPKKGVYVVLHAHNPAVGMPNFRAWLKDSKPNKQSPPKEGTGTASQPWPLDNEPPAEISYPVQCPTPAALLRAGAPPPRAAGGGEYQDLMDSLDAALAQLGQDAGGDRPLSKGGALSAAAGSTPLSKGDVLSSAAGGRRSIHVGFKRSQGPDLGSSADKEPPAPGASAQGSRASGLSDPDDDRTSNWVLSGGSQTSKARPHAALLQLPVQPGSLRLAGGSEGSSGEVEEGKEAAVPPRSPSPGAVGGAGAAAAAVVVSEAEAAEPAERPATAAAPAPQAEAPGGSYRRGQRFKTIARMLTGEAARRSLQRFKTMAWAAAAFVLAVTLAGFVTMYVLLRSQEADVEVLNIVGLTGVYTANIFMALANCDIVFTNSFVPGLPGIESPADVPSTCIAALTTNAELMDAHLTRSYFTVMGLQGAAAERVQGLWNEPTSNFTHFWDGYVTKEMDYGFKFVTATFAESYNASLWDIGNVYVSTAQYMAQNIEAHSAVTYRSWRDWSYPKIVDTNCDVLLQGIAVTLDDLVQIVIDKGQKVNQVHYILMAVEGFVCSSIAVLFIFTITTRMSLQRWNLYNVFMVIPVNLLRTLAKKTAAFEGLGNVEEPLLPHSAGDSNQDDGGLVPDEATGVMKLSIIGSNRGEGPSLSSSRKGEGWRLRPLLSALMFWRSRSAQVSPIYTRRRLNRSHLPALWLCSPFLAWGVMMIAINATGHTKLASVSGPIAIFNLVNFVVIQFYRTMGIMEDFIQTAADAIMDADRARMSFNTSGMGYSLPMQYQAMLYGGAAVPDDQSAHFTLATTGIISSGGGGADILYNIKECLRFNQSSCLNSTHPLYPYTVGGLDNLMKLFMSTVNTTLGLDKMYIRSYFQDIPEFAVLWNIRDDIEGGLKMLNAAYYDHVIKVYTGTLTVHVVGLVLTVLLMAVFVLLMLRPYARQMTNEAKRIAELLSMLPADVDVEGLVRSAQIRSALDSGKDDDKNNTSSFLGSSQQDSQAFEP